MLSSSIRRIVFTGLIFTAVSASAAQARDYHFGCIDLNTGDQYTGVLHCFTVSASNKNAALDVVRNDSRYFRGGKAICSSYGTGGDPYNRFAAYPSWYTNPGRGSGSGCIHAGPGNQ